MEHHIQPFDIVNPNVHFFKQLQGHGVSVYVRFIDGLIELTVTWFLSGLSLSSSLSPLPLSYAYRYIYLLDHFQHPVRYNKHLSGYFSSSTHQISRRENERLHLEYNVV